MPDGLVQARLEQDGPTSLELDLLGVRLGPSFVVVVPERAPPRERGDLVERKVDLPARLAVGTPALAKPAAVLRRGLSRGYRDRLQLDPDDRRAGCAASLQPRPTPACRQYLIPG